ncbi:unnamed protein product [Ambrosiozyma monospora]|uniref:Unnamed protein product n=1 Tax=Ambrosiozyma monospora TaxID=43982 RepID=A0A9W6Z208_AMBMO|nr:unnamed protein product [Ambrosiozyma monospora]
MSTSSFSSIIVVAYDSEDSFIADDDEDDGYGGGYRDRDRDRRRGGYGGSSSRRRREPEDEGYDRDAIWSIFNRGRKRNYYDDYDDDDDDMEATGGEILEDEERIAGHEYSHLEK